MAFPDSTQRVIPSAYRDDVGESTRILPASWQWSELAEVLTQYQPAGLGLVMPFSWQMHWYAYQVARECGIYTAVAMPTNPTALSGLMRTLPIDAVVVSELGAQALHDDLRAEHMLARIRVWILVVPPGTRSVFRPEQGVVVQLMLP